MIMGPPAVLIMHNLIEVVHLLFIHRSPQQKGILRFQGMGHLQTCLPVLEGRTSFCLGKPERTNIVIQLLGICALL